jgi:DNA adenine methylase
MPGGKSLLSKFIIDNMPKNYEQMDFIDAYGGAGNIILNKKPSVSEAYNDIHRPTYLMMVYAKSGQLYENIRGTRYDQVVFDKAKNLTPTDDITIAVKEYICRNMSRGGMKKDFAWSERLRGGDFGDRNAWNNKVEQLPLIRKRLEKVELYNERALTCLRRFNNINAFFYGDPPYLKSTRVSKKLYDEEMSYEDHEELIVFLNNEWKGLYLLSGYDNALYNDSLNFKNKASKELPCHAGQTKTKTRRIEYLYFNY